MTPIDLNDPIAVLIAAFQALERRSVEVAVYGGLALAVYGEPRETKDADLAVAGIGAAEAETAFRESGFDVISAFDRVQFGGQLVSRVTLIGGAGGSLNTVDLVEARSGRYASQVLTRSLTASLREEALRVVSPEDFIVLKLLATRERDLEDAGTVIRSLVDRVDLKLIEGEVDILAIEIPDFDIRNRWIRVKTALEERRS